jgi:hypothetical protein
VSSLTKDANYPHDRNIYPAIFQAGVLLCLSPAGGSDSRPWQTNRQSDPASAGSGANPSFQALRQLPNPVHVVHDCVWMPRSTPIPLPVKSGRQDVLAKSVNDYPPSTPGWRWHKPPGSHCCWSGGMGDALTCLKLPYKPQSGITLARLRCRFAGYCHKASWNFKRFSQPTWRQHLSRFCCGSANAGMWRCHLKKCVPI